MTYSRNSAVAGRRAGRWAVAAIAVVIGVGLAGCTTPPPEGLLNVPGSYTANLWEPGGSNAATVLMCLDEASAVHLDSPPGEPGIGYISLRWFGVEHVANGNGDATELTTPVIPAGCGRLIFIVDCCHVDNYLTIEATKVDQGSSQ